MIASQAGHVHKRCTPALLYVGFPAVGIVRSCMSVCSQPQVNTRGLCSQYILKCAGIRFTVHPVQERCALRRALRKVSVIVGLPRSIFIALHTLPLAGRDGSIFEHVMMRADDN